MREQAPPDHGAKGEKMCLNEPLDVMIRQIHDLTREECVAELRSLSRPRLDFTDEYLGNMSLEQLRHVLLAACLQARKALVKG